MALRMGCNASLGCSGRRLYLDCSQSPRQQTGLQEHAPSWVGAMIAQISKTPSSSTLSATSACDCFAPFLRCRDSDDDMIVDQATNLRGKAEDTVDV